MKIVIKQYFLLCMIIMMHDAYGFIPSSTVPNSVIGTIYNPGIAFMNPQAIAITPDGTTAYVANYGSNSITIVEVSDSTAIGIVTDTNFTLNNPIAIAIAPDNKTAYVVNYTGNSMSIIDIATNTVTGVISGDEFAHPNAIAITPDGATAYVTNGAITVITIVDLATLDISNITNTDFSNLAAIAITPDGTAAYVACNNDVVYMINLTTQAITMISDPDTTFDGPVSIAITPNGIMAYVVNNRGNTVSIIDLRVGSHYNTVTGIVTDAGSTIQNPATIAITPDGVAGYVTNDGTNTISIIEIATNKITGAITDISFNESSPIAITPNGSMAYVGNIGNNEISILFIEDSVQPPSSIKVKLIINNFLMRTQLVNVITWTVPTSSPQPTSYTIYRDAALTEFVATIPAAGPLEYYDYNLQANITYNYYIVSNLNGFSSTAISTLITPVG